MHPARSLILFTTLSGLGFGLMIWLGLGLPRVTGWQAFGGYLIAFALAGTGLISSVFHLGRPERALRAFTQWRSSWLSREAWLAVLALTLNGAYALTAMSGAPVAPLGWLGALAALATVGATSMIYAQIKAVPRWHHWTTPALFLSLALAGGAMIAGLGTLGLIGLAVAGVVQVLAWRGGDTRLAETGTDLGTATGLGAIGSVRAFEPPHTGGNYLTHEMIHVVGRKHAAKLRRIGAALALAVPAVVILLGLPPLAAVVHLAGVLVLRWLFFAEAEHVVGLYYGKR